MEENIFNLNDKIYSNNNNILLEIIKELQVIINKSKDDLIIKILSNVIIKMNNIINENKKNLELIKNDILSLINKRFDEINYNNEKELKLDRYEGEFKNNGREGKGIYYNANGDREMGDYSNDNKIGKHVMLTKYGEVKVKNY